MSRVELAKIRALTFYKNELTTSRRTSPIAQLICRGTPCKLYSPEVVRCETLPGGIGADVDWKCEADLPESLRFGRVEVSCEGWSQPGDSFVLKGSCSLEYRLVEIPDALRNSDSPHSSPSAFDLPAMLFTVLWVGVLFFILYSFFLSCLQRQNVPRAPRSQGPPPGDSRWFPGSFDNDSNDHPPPPPYTKHPPQQANAGWRPGFWSGAALGGLANHVFNNRRQSQPGQTTYDWERDRTSRVPLPLRRQIPVVSEDRGEGSSNLGAMRRSTGLGGSNVR